jgi:uncharacterized protein
MFVGVCRVALHLPGNGSLKGKRKIVSSLVGRTRAKFNAGVAEVEDNDILQKAVIGITVVGNDGRHVDSMLQKISGFIDQVGLAPVLSIQTETIAFGDQIGEETSWEPADNWPPNDVDDSEQEDDPW